MVLNFRDMKWLSEHSQYRSLKNGRIDVRRFLGQWSISVDDCGQTTAYTNAMWRESFAKVAQMGVHVRSACMLGLGAAGAVPYLHKQFPGCTVTAVEYDSEMIKLAKKLSLNKTFPFPRIIEDDAKSAVATFRESFDLIIVDLFNGPEPSLLIKDEQFISALKDALSSHGVCLVNVFRKQHYLEAPKRFFRYCHEYRYRNNALGIFWDYET